MGLRADSEVTLLLGPPGAGKGTQARLLAEALGKPHVASGDLLREQAKMGTAFGLAAKEFIDRGDLVPDELVVDMIMHRLAEPAGRPVPLGVAAGHRRVLGRAGGPTRPDPVRRVPVGPVGVQSG